MENDAISRRGVLDRLGYYISHSMEPSRYAYEVAHREIATAPALDAVPVVHGHWVHCKGRSNLWYCSECGDKMLYSPTRRVYNIIKLPMAEKNKFCRNCGAKMDGEAE